MSDCVRDHVYVEPPNQAHTRKWIDEMIPPNVKCAGSVELVASVKYKSCLYLENESNRHLTAISVVEKHGRLD